MKKKLFSRSGLAVLVVVLLAGMFLLAAPFLSSRPHPAAPPAPVIGSGMEETPPPMDGDARFVEETFGGMLVDRMNLDFLLTPGLLVRDVLRKTPTPVFFQHLAEWGEAPPRLPDADQENTRSGMVSFDCVYVFRHPGRGDQGVLVMRYWVSYDMVTYAVRSEVPLRCSGFVVPAAGTVFQQTPELASYVYAGKLRTVSEPFDPASAFARTLKAPSTESKCGLWPMETTPLLEMHPSSMPDVPFAPPCATLTTRSDGRSEKLDIFRKDGALMASTMYEYSGADGALSHIQAKLPELRVGYDPQSLLPYPDRYGDGKAPVKEYVIRERVADVLFLGGREDKGTGWPSEIRETETGKNGMLRHAVLSNFSVIEEAHSPGEILSAATEFAQSDKWDEPIYATTHALNSLGPEAFSPEQRGILEKYALSGEACGELAAMDPPDFNCLEQAFLSAMFLGDENAVASVLDSCVSAANRLGGTPVGMRTGAHLLEVVLINRRDAVFSAARQAWHDACLRSAATPDVLDYVEHGRKNPGEGYFAMGLLEFWLSSHSDLSPSETLALNGHYAALLEWLCAVPPEQLQQAVDSFCLPPSVTPEVQDRLRADKIPAAVSGAIEAMMKIESPSEEDKRLFTEALGVQSRLSIPRQDPSMFLAPDPMKNE